MADGKNIEPALKERVVELWRLLSPYAARLWGKRSFLLFSNGIVLVVMLVILLFVVKPYYDSTVAILPDYGNQAGTMLGQLSGLAGLAGIRVGDTNPVLVYENLLYSEAVWESVLLGTFATEEFPQPVNLIEYFKIAPDAGLPDSLRERQQFLDALKIFREERLRTDVDRYSNILSITIRMPERGLASDVVNSLASSLDEYVRLQRRSFATEQRKYVEARLAEVADSLQMAEDSLAAFRRQNRQISQSPDLLLQDARLFRMVTMKQTVFMELTKQYELLKIEEIKDTPVINIREEARVPVEKTGPKRTLILIGVMTVSAILTGLFVAFRPEATEMVSLIREMTVRDGSERT